MAEPERLKRGASMTEVEEWAKEHIRHSLDVIGGAVEDMKSYLNTDKDFVFFADGNMEAVRNHIGRVEQMSTVLYALDQMEMVEK